MINHCNHAAWLTWSRPTFTLDISIHPTIVQNSRCHRLVICHLTYDWHQQNPASEFPATRLAESYKCTNNVTMCAWRVIQIMSLNVITWYVLINKLNMILNTWNYHNNNNSNTPNIRTYYALNTKLIISYQIRDIRYATNRYVKRGRLSTRAFRLLFIDKKFTLKNGPLVHFYGVHLQS